ncbi:hypothetical protein [Natronolimnohabitans innermongolicus]|nr:hypothetical protein [Natronolimnohabitans innermongolicus]
MRGTLAALAALLLILWWLASYARERDAADATENVAGAVFAVIIGAVAAVLALLGEAASAVAMVGDLVGAHAPYLAHLATTVWGWLALEHLEIPPAWWVGVALGIMIVLVMFGRDGW